MRVMLCLLAGVLLVSCGDDGEGASAPPVVISTSLARFGLAESGAMDWGDVPFPNDLYRNESGTIRIGDFPNAKTDGPLFAAMRELVESRDGFCATCNIYFEIDGAIDPSTFPSQEAATVDDAIVLADVDPQSPDRGRLFPLRIEWNPTEQRLAVRPIRGIALHRKRRYAAVLTTDLRATDGTPLGPSDDFVRVRNRRSSGDPTIDRARAVLAPAFKELERLGIDRDRVVAMAAFTTEDVTADVLGARAAVQGGGPLEVVIERRRRGEEIDELLGIPSVERPGIDVPPAPDVEGTRSIAHASLVEVITGYFLAPRIVSGSATDIGTVRRDAAGRIAPGPREPVPFLLTLPASSAGGALPIVVAHHGFNASRTTGFASAETMARAGVAVLAIDAFQHGERATSAVDSLHALRGDLPGPDGFAETSPFDLSARVFGLVGGAPGLELFPGYSLGAFLQFGADIASAVRVIREGELARQVEEGGAEDLQGFDTARIGFIGNSLGAVVGASVLTAEPDVRFGVQNVPPGSIIETLTESPEFRPLVELIFLPILGVQGPFDELDRHLIFDPTIDLSRWILEPIDPLALAPYLLLDPVAGKEPAEILFQVAVLDEVAAPLPTESMLAASGSTRITRYDPAAHGMLEVLHQSSRLQSPATPPFMPRPVELPVVNPLEEEHQEIEAFVAQNVDS